MENGLIIFVRNAEKGKIKTRLAKTIGDDKALQVYQYLLQYTRDITYPCNCNHFVFYSDYVHIGDVFDDDFYSKRVQEGHDLGERMMNAFKKVLESGCKKVCIIGSDCHELQTETIDQAFSELEQHDVVIGPATDGGYYLLGMKEIAAEVFSDKQWGTETVLENTIETLERLGVSYTKLSALSDIDTEGDLMKTNILTNIKEETE